MSDEIKISVIVPVYNVKRYLHRCIDSILAQTLKEFELILIDDGTPDRSGAICDEYAARDNRICVIHQANAGVSAARNAGLEVAEGTWATFIDSDDWVAPEYLETIYKAVTENDVSDFVIGGYTAIHDGQVTDKLRFKEARIDGQNFKALFAEFHIYDYGFIASKLYMMDIVRRFGLKFHPKITLGEDVCFMYDYLVHIDSVRFINTEDIYFYNVDAPESLTKKQLPFWVEKEGYLIARKYAQKFAKYGSTKELGFDYVQAYYLKRTIRALYHECGNSGERIDELKKLDTSLLKPASEAATWKERILNLLLVAHCWKTYDMLMSRL